MITERDVANYIGTPYLKKGRDLKGIDCWGLMLHVENKYFDLKLPEANLENPVECLALFTQNMHAGEWQVIAPHEAQNGDGVLLRSGSSPHVGIYLFGGVLHALEDIGVVFTRVTELPFHGFGRVVFYRLHK